MHSGMTGWDIRESQDGSAKMTIMVLSSSTFREVTNNFVKGNISPQSSQGPQPNGASAPVSKQKIDDAD